MNNNLIKCQDCGAEISISASSCPKCGSIANAMPSKDPVVDILKTIAFVVPVGGTFFLAGSMLVKAEKGGLNLFFWLTFFVLTGLLFATKKIVNKLEEKNWYYKDHTSKKMTYILYLPAWLVYVWSFDAPISIWYKSNIGFTNTSVAISWILTIALLVFGYKKFLRYFNLID